MLEMTSGGIYTTVQDYPGRTGYWDVGVPPSGPMDFRAFQIANILVGNSAGAAGLEITMYGPEIRFTEDHVVCLAGAPMDARLNGADVPFWRAIPVKSGDELVIEGLAGYGCRAYLAVAGGIDVPEYLGSRSTFPTGGLGGFQGRPLTDGDVLAVARPAGRVRPDAALAAADIPSYTDVWELATLVGPHGAPDYFTPEDVELFFSTEWEVSLNSSRLGYRLEGPKVTFARASGGEGGSHPSNLIDYSYGIGAVNFTGTTPVILTADGPSLGGFVCMATVASADMWKIGQAKPGDKVCFKIATLAAADALRAQSAAFLAGLAESLKS